MLKYKIKLFYDLLKKYINFQLIDILIIFSLLQSKKHFFFFQYKFEVFKLKMYIIIINLLIIII